MLYPKAMQSRVTSGCSLRPSRRNPSWQNVRKHSAAPSVLWARMPTCFMIAPAVRVPSDPANPNIRFGQEDLASRAGHDDGTRKRSSMPRLSSRTPPLALVVIGYPRSRRGQHDRVGRAVPQQRMTLQRRNRIDGHARSEEHTSELQSRRDLVCRLLLEKKKTERPGPPYGWGSRKEIPN